METAGVTKISSPSKEKHGLHYTSFYGDGDSKPCPALKDIYGRSKPIKKFECVGHYQKCVGSRLCNLKTKNTKGLGGKRKFTNTKIGTMQNYFGIGLRSNVGSYILAAMNSACMASMYHICDYHDNCPKPADTWCQYQKDKQDNTNYYKSEGDLPIDVRRAILPIHQSLCKSEMLEKCLHGKTQNTNELFNGMIWNRVPKATHLGLDVLSVGVYDATAHFNIGDYLRYYGIT